MAAGSRRTAWARFSSGQLAREYGFTDLDGSRPDIRRHIEEIRERGLDASPDDYR